MHRALATALLVLLTACTGLPEGVDAVDNVDPDRYLGTWYEVARLDHSFERGLSDVSATYTARDDGGIDVLNKGYDTESREWSQAEGKAYPLEDGDWSQLKVSFFGPFYGGYNIIALDPDYGWAMVAGPNRDYLWILARDPALDQAVVDRLVAQAAALEFDTGELIFVEHGTAPAERTP